MAAIHDVLRYLLERVPHNTQEDHDRIAAVIYEDENPQSASDEDDAEATEET